MKKVLMLGFLVGEELFGRYASLDRSPQVAAKKLESAYMDGFVQNGVSVGVLGFFPASTFPSNRNFMFGFHNWGARRWALPFFNVLGVKLLTKLFSSLVGFIFWRFRYGKVDALCIYSLHSPYLIAGVVIKALFGTKFFVIAPDLPLMMREAAGQSEFVLFFKKLDNALIDACLGFASGLSLVTNQMHEVLSPDGSIPYVVIEGLSQSKPQQEVVQYEPVSGRPYFMYSGGLSEAYGVGVVVRAFIKANLDVDLVICGSGPLERYLLELARMDSRIRYLGFLGQGELGSLQRGALALFLVRSIDSEFVKFSFPSKLIEYMGSGTPVVCTRLPGVPDDYFKYLFVLEDSDEDSVKEVMVGFSDTFHRNAKEVAVRASDFVRNRTDPKNRVKEFIDLIFETGGH